MGPDREGGEHTVVHVCTSLPDTSASMYMNYRIVVQQFYVRSHVFVSLYFSNTLP